MALLQPDLLNLRGRQRAAPAFTLIEVLLAVAIFAIVLTAIHMVFYGALRLRSQASEVIAQGLPLQQTLAIIRRDLANLVMPGGTFSGELQTTRSTTLTSNSLDVLSPMNDAVIGQSSPAFFTASGLIQDNVPWGEIVRVSYFLAPPTNNLPGKTLIRSVTRNLLPVLHEEPENQSLMSGLQSIIFSFYDGLQWREYWDSTVESNKLPWGIRVQLQMAPSDRDVSRRDPIELVVPVVLQPGTNQPSVSTGEE